MTGFTAGIQSKLLAWLAYRAGQKAQKAADNAAELEIAKSQADIDARVSAMSDDERRKFLRDPANYK